MYQQTLCRAIKREISILDYAQRMGFHPYRVGNDQYSCQDFEISWRWNMPVITGRPCPFGCREGIGAG